MSFKYSSGVDPNGQGGIVYSTPGGQTGVPNPNFSVGQQMAPGQQQQPGSVVYVSPHQQTTTVYAGGHQGGIIYGQGPQQQPPGYGV